MFVIGTAGHVDHGKSTLVEALTGIDPDRLNEEKEREMTIDLGFAWLQLGEEEVGVVDVPGHRDFIENMLAGVGGIDLALFVVAADEGAMPQTREHLAILDLLEVNSGIVALTKVDLIDDPDWLELVMLDLDETFAGTVLEDAPIMPVSAKTGEGLADLRALLTEKLATAVPRPDNGRPRLPVDRVFTVAGFGTIVTGTLLDGRFRLGDGVELQPTGKNGRIRGLQTHKTKLDVARPGSRVAINITGIGKDEVQRGNVVVLPNMVGGTILFDASYRHLAAADAPLKHNMEVKLFVGATEVVARTRVLGAKQIDPGETGWLQLALSESAAMVRGDRFILRRPSPGATLGGGKVLDPYPGRRHRRFRPEVIERLKTLTQGTPAELLLQTIKRLEPINSVNLFKQANMDKVEAERSLAELIEADEVVVLGKQLMSRPGFEQNQDKIRALLADFHRDYPLRLGLSREEVRSRLRLSAAVFTPLLVQMEEKGLLVAAGALLHAPEHEVVFSERQQTAVNRLMNQFEKTGVNSPSVKESKTAVGEDVYFALVDLGQLRPISNDVVYTSDGYSQIVERVKSHLAQQGSINAAQARDLFQTSRKYAIAILEHLDEIRVTRRVGDSRELF